MPNGNTPSLGIGIGLAAQPDLFSGIAYASKSAEEQRKAAEAAAKQKKLADEMGEYNDLMKSIKVEGVDPIYSKKIQLETAKVIDLMRQKKAEDPYGFWSNSPDLVDAVNNLKFQVNDYKVASDKIKTDFNQYFQDPSKYNDPNTQELYQAYKSGDYQKWSDLLSTQGSDDKYTGGLFSMKEKPFDAYVPLKNLSPVVKTYDITVETPTGKKVKGGTYIDENATMAQAIDFVNGNTEYVQSLMKQGYIKDPSQAPQFIFDYLKSQAKTGSKSVEEQKTGNDYQYGSGFAENDKYRIAYTKYDEKKDVTPMTYVGPFGESVTITPPSGKGNVQEIRLSNKKGENGAIYVNDPKDPSGSKIQVIPLGMQKVGDGDWQMVGVKKIEVPNILDPSGKPTYKYEQINVDYDQAKDDLSAQFDGFELNDFLEKSGPGKQEEKVVVKKTETKPQTLSGQIDPSTLVKGQPYIVNGKTYIWNGTKLIAQ